MTEAILERPVIDPVEVAATGSLRARLQSAEKDLRGKIRDRVLGSSTPGSEKQGAEDGELIPEYLSVVMDLHRMKDGDPVQLSEELAGLQMLAQGLSSRKKDLER